MRKYLCKAGEFLFLAMFFLAIVGMFVALFSAIKAGVVGGITNVEISDHLETAFFMVVAAVVSIYAWTKSEEIFKYGRENKPIRKASKRTTR